jgi:hypothetical protein
MKFITSLLFVVSALCAFSQSSAVYVYKITPDQAERLFEYDGAEELILPDYFFEKKITEFQFPDQAHLALGHYLFVSLQGENLKIDLVTKQSIAVELFDRGQKPAIQVFGENGRLIKVRRLKTHKIHKPINSRKYKMGPSYRLDTLSFLKQAHFLTRLKFEPGFVYEVEANRERLFENKFWRNRVYKLPKVRGLKYPKAVIQPPEKLVLEKRKKKTKTYDNFLSFKEKGSGRYSFRVADAVADSLLFVGLENENGETYVFEPYTRVLKAMPAGDHHLQPRFKGQFTMNPVKVEQMYFPVFNGNNEIKKIEIR